jgi:site-specific DNA-cytosine methylase
MNKVILDLCGGTGSWSKPYKDNGYDVRVITLPEHDVRTYKPPKNVYGILAAPPCDQFSFAKTTGKPRDLKTAWSIVRGCLNIIAECNRIKTPYAKTTALKFWCLENPNGLLKRFLGKPVFTFHPWEFGENYKKQTSLWGWFNEPKKFVKKIDEAMTADEIELCKTNSRTLPKFDRMKSKDIHPEYFEQLTRQERRSITPEGFAKAFFKENR